MARGRGGRGGRRGGRRGGQGNKGRSSKGKSKSKSKSRSKSRGASTGRRGGQGNRGRTSTKNNPSSNKGKRGGYGKGGDSTGRKGGQGNRRTKPGRAKGYSVKSVAKSLSRALSSAGRVASNLRSGGLRAAASRAAAKAANKKQQTKLRQQISNFQARVKQLSTPEAKRERIRRRLRDQHGLDYDRMREGMTIKADIGMALNRAHKIPGTNIKVKVPKSWVKRVPQSIKNVKFNHTLRSPTKLGAADGWTRKNARFPRNNNSIRQAMLARTGPQQDWLADLYSSHNINQGNLDQGARDYWSNEAKTRGRDAVIQSIIGTSKAEGTYGGRKKPLTAKPQSRDLVRTIAAAMAARGM